MLTLFVLSVSLALDALSVSVAEGAVVREKPYNLALKLAFSFGFFQSGMAGLGAALGELLTQTLQTVDQWIAFTVFSMLGLKMIKDSYSKEEERPALTLKLLLLLGLATSIDAGAVGITLPTLSQPLTVSIFMIGAVTFILCFTGAILGRKIQENLKKISLERMGGVILLLLAIKSLL